MVELNRKHNLSTIPSIDNDGNAYVIPLDIYKEGYQAYDISNWFKGRVGDNGTPFAIRWYSHGRLLNIQGKRPFIEGQVGDYTIDDSDPDNPQITMAEDAANIHVVGDVTDTQEGGIAIYRLISQAFPKSGIFYGKIGFMGVQDDGTLANTGVDIVFKVLAGHMNMLGARQFYVSELEKAWLDLQEKIRQYDQQYKDQIKQQSDQFAKDTQEQADKFKQETEQALADLNTKIANEIKRAEDTLGDTQASIDANLASLKKIAASVGALQAQLDADNLETIPQHNADIYDLRQKFDNQIANIHLSPERFATLDDVKSQYPTGSHNLITTDDGYTAIWKNGAWQRGNLYQGIGIPDQSIDDSKLTNLTVNWKVSYDLPVVLDWNERTLTIKKDCHILLHAKNRNHITLSAGTFKWDKNMAYVFVSASSDGKEMKFYNSFNDIPDDEPFLGYIMFYQRLFKFCFKVITSEQESVDSNPSTETYIDEKHLPPIRNYGVMGSKIFVDFDKGVLIVNNNYAIIYKQQTYLIKPGKYDLHDEKNLLEDGWIYLNYDPATNETSIKYFNDPVGNNSYENMPCIGYVQFSSKNFYLLSYGQTMNARADKYFINVFGNSIKVDFDKKEVIFPSLSHFYIPYYVDFHDLESFSIPLKHNDGKEDNSGYFFGIDPAKLSSTDNESFKHAIVVEDHPQALDNCLFLGWVETKSKVYDFGELGSSFKNAELSNKVDKSFANKEITCLGDSITAGDGGEGSMIDSYVPRMGKFLGTIPTNKGVCGSTVTKASDRSDSFVERISDIKNQDVVTIFGGTNDFFLSRELGKFNDNPENPTTFYAALKYLILHLSEQNPMAKFLIMTPTRSSKDGWAKYDADGNLIKNKAGYTVDDYCNAIRKVAEYYSIPVLDLQKGGNYNPCIPSQKGHDALSADGLHPTAKGYDRLAQTIAARINLL